MRNLFVTRSIEALSEETHEAQGPKLRRALGPWALIAVGLGNMVGAGIFATIGDGIHNKAGPAVIISFLIAAVACAFAALCYAELSSMVPIAGSAYTYTYATIGELVAWVIGFDLILEYGLSAAPVASTLSANVQSLLASIGVHLPAWTTAAPASFQQLTAHPTFDLVAFLGVMAFSGLLALGIRESAGTNSIIVIIKMVILVAFVAAGVWFIHPENWHTFAPFGFSGVIQGAFTVFFAFIGFDAVTTTAEEAKNPQRDIPLGVLGALAIGALFYVAIAVVLTGMVTYAKVDPAAPLAAALQGVHLGWLAGIMAWGAVLGTISVILTSLLGQSRIFYVMARDGLLPKWVAEVHPVFRTPVRMTLITGFLIALCAALVPLDALLSLVNIGTFGAFLLVCAGVMVLRRTQPLRERRFRAPLVPLVPILGIALSLFLIFYGSEPVVWIRFGVWLVVGLVIYFAYGYWHSEARKALVAKDTGA